MGGLGGDGGEDDPPNRRRRACASCLRAACTSDAAAKPQSGSEPGIEAEAASAEEVGMRPMRWLQSKHSEPSTHTLYCDPGPPSSQTPSLAYEQVLEQSAARVPQSMQSVPMSQELNSEPRPPSSQPPSVEYVHVFVQISATTTLETAIATAATRRMRRIDVILWPIVLRSTQSVSQFHGPAPRSPHRLSVRLRQSRSTQVPSTRSRGLLNCRK